MRAVGLSPSMELIMSTSQSDGVRDAVYDAIAAGASSIKIPAPWFDDDGTANFKVDFRFKLTREEFARFRAYADSKGKSSAQVARRFAKDAFRDCLTVAE
jgi:hypothetical protein